MRELSSELVRIEPLGAEGPPELSDEVYFVSSMATHAVDPGAARAFVRKKYWIATFILIFAVGLPLTLLGITAIPNIPRWLTQIGVWIALAVFFIFFYAMIFAILSKHKVLKFMGIAPVTQPNAERPDVLMLADRYDRHFEYGQTPDGNFWRYPKPAPAFQIEYRDGAFYASPALPPRIAQVLTHIPPHRRWKKLTLDSGPQGIQTRRPIRKANYFLYDLWLLEKIIATMK